MKIIAFHPQSFRNLPNRSIRIFDQADPFPISDPGCSIRFLVGKNGTGKTNLLRFLASIFLALEGNYRRPHPGSPAYFIPYRLVYELHDQQIEIHSGGSGRSGITFTIDDQVLDAGDIPSMDSILPATLLVYTSGDYDEWASLFRSSPEIDDDEDDDIDFGELRSEYERPPNEEIQASQELSDDFEMSMEDDDSFQIQDPSRVFLVKPDHLKIALLSALLDYQYRQPEESALSDALAEVSVRLLSFSFHIGLSDRHPSSTQRRFLSHLYDLSTLSLDYWDEQQWVYDLVEKDIETGETVLSLFGENHLLDPMRFFQAITTLYDSGVIHAINLTLEYIPPGKDHKFKRVLLSDSLSDGEFAFLSRMALIYLLKEKECLFFLDEPEVHFNDDWKRNLVDSIERALVHTNSEVILTSHASIVLTDAYPNEVILLTFGGQEENIPLTFAAEQGEVLRMIFDSERSVGRRAMRHVQQMIDEGTIKELEDFLDQVGPGHYRFKIIRELQSRVSSAQEDKLSPSE